MFNHVKASVPGNLWRWETRVVAELSRLVYKVDMIWRTWQSIFVLKSSASMTNCLALPNLACCLLTDSPSYLP